MTLWCLRELRALRGETSFFIKYKKITTKVLKRRRRPIIQRVQILT
jgi:hypothetical protein